MGTSGIAGLVTGFLHRRNLEGLEVGSVLRWLLWCVLHRERWPGSGKCGGRITIKLVGDKIRKSSYLWTWGSVGWRVRGAK